MTVGQFDVAAKRAGISPLLRARARRVLVDAEQSADVAKSDGISACGGFSHAMQTNPAELHFGLG